MNKEIIKRSTCRISNEKLVPLFSLGKLHLSDFVSPTSEVEKEKVDIEPGLVSNIKQTFEKLEMRRQQSRF